MFSLNNKGISTFDSENASISPEVEAVKIIIIYIINIIINNIFLITIMLLIYFIYFKD
jgi:hypothetical protein